MKAKWNLAKYYYRKDTECSISQSSGDLKSGHSKSGNIWNPDWLKIRFQMVRFSKGWALPLAMVRTIPKGSHLLGFQIDFWLLDFRSHSKSGPIASQTFFVRLKCRLVRISDPHCIQLQSWICTATGILNWKWRKSMNIYDCTWSSCLIQKSTQMWKQMMTKMKMI